MINPILERELKTRMRTWRTPIIIMIYLLVLGIIVTLFFASYNPGYYGFGRGTLNPSMAIYVYDVLVFGQFIFLMLILPAFTATSISGERERQTLDLLLCTDLSPWQIIFGKMFSALGFVFIMIITAAPFMGIVFIFGGVSILDIVKVLLFFMLTSIMVSTIGMYCSIRFKKVITSIIMSYLIMGVLFVGTLIAFGIFVAILNLKGYYTFVDEHAYELILAFLGPNPGLGLFSFIYSEDLNLWMFGYYSTSFLTKIKPWMVSAVFDVILSTILLVLARFRLTRIR